MPNATDTRTPAQKSADTRAANKAKKLADQAAADQAAADQAAADQAAATPAVDVAELETTAREALDTLVVDQDRLADALTALYVTAPWGEGTPADYAAKLGIVPLSSPLMTDRRHRVVKAVYAAVAKITVADVAALTGVSEPTIARDRKDLAITNGNRSAAQVKDKTTAEGDGDGGELVAAVVVKDYTVAMNTFIGSVLPKLNREQLSALTDAVATANANINRADKINGKG